MNQITLMWILTAVNFIVFIAWEIKYRALYKAYVVVLAVFTELVKQEVDGLEKVRDALKEGNNE